MGWAMYRLLFVAASVVLIGMSLATVVDPSVFRQELHWSGVSNVVSMTFAKDGSVFLVEKVGRIRLYTSIDSDAGDFTYVFDQMFETTYTWWDRGMLNAAIHPDYPTVPLLWVFFSVNRLTDVNGPDINIFDKASCPPERDSYCGTAARLVRVRVDVPAKKGTIEQILVSDWCSGSGSHHIGDLVWASDGGLFLTAGDGSSFDFADLGVPTDRCYNPTDTRLQGSFRSQHMEYLQGKLLHITKDALMATRAITVAAGDMKILAKGLRNPYRFAVQPGTLDIYIGDVGSDFWEEINLLPNPLDPANANTVVNFGWPCYEGIQPMPKFAPHNFPECIALATDPLYHPPWFTYTRAATISSDDPDATHCNAVNVSPTGIMFYTGTYFPEAYKGKMFWQDGSKRCVFYFDNTPAGKPDPTKLHTVLWTPQTLNKETGFMAQAGQWVDIKEAPSGIIFLIDFYDSAISKLLAQGVTSDPYAYIDIANARSLTVPFTTILDGTRSNTINVGDSLKTFTWDFGKGKTVSGDRDAFQKIEATFNYGVHTVKLTVTDTGGRTKTATATVAVGVDFNWNIQFIPKNHEWDLLDSSVGWQADVTTDQGAIVPADKLTWRVVINHCVESYCGNQVDCHVHPVDIGVGSQTGFTGSFAPFSHPLPSFWEVTATAEHPSWPGFKASKSFQLNSLMNQVVLETRPLGLPLDQCIKTPCFISIMAASITEWTATSIVAQGVQLYKFSYWDVPSRPTTTSYRFKPTGDTILVAVYAPVQFASINTAGILVPTDLAAIPGFAQIGLSWRPPPNVTPAWYVVTTTQQGKDPFMVVLLGTTTSVTIPVSPTPATFSVTVAIATDVLQAGPESAALLVTSLAKPSVGFVGLCVPCFNDATMVDDFEDAARFANGMSLLGGIIGTDNTMGATKREKLKTSWMMTMIPIDRPGGSVLYFVLGTATSCFNFNPLSLPYTSLEFDIVLPRAGADVEVRLTGNRLNCKMQSTVLALFKLSDFVDIGSGGPTTVQHVSLPITLRDLKTAVQSITFSGFSDVGRVYRLDNIQLRRDCKHVETALVLAVNDCRFIVDDFADANRFAIGHNLVPGPFDGTSRGDVGEISMGEMLRTEDGRLSLVARKGGRVWENLAQPGFCFDMLANSLEYVSFDLAGDMGSAFDVRLAVNLDDCSQRDDTNGSIFLATVNDWGGFASRTGAMTNVLIPLTAFGTTNLRHVHGIEFLHFAPFGERLFIDNVALVQRCGIPTRKLFPTWCTLVVDDFSSVKSFMSGINNMGGFINFTTTPKLVRPGVMSLTPLATTDVISFDVYDWGRMLCVDLTLYDFAVVTLIATGAIDIDFQLEIESHPGDCGGDPSAPASRAAVAVKPFLSRTTRDPSTIKYSIPVAQFATVPLNNVHTVRLSGMAPNVELQIQSIEFRRDECAQFMPDRTLSLECDMLVIDNFADKATFASTNSLGLLHSHDNSMVSMIRTPMGMMTLVPKDDGGSYFYSIIGDCVDLSKYKYLHITVQAQAGFDMSIYLQRSGSCVGDKTPASPLLLGQVSEFVSVDGTRKHLWIPLDMIDAQALKKIASITLSNLVKGDGADASVTVGDLFVAAGGCTPYWVNRPSRNPKQMTLLGWLAIAGSVLLIVIIFAVKWRGARRAKKLTDIDSSTSEASVYVPSRVPPVPKLIIPDASRDSSRMSPLPSWLRPRTPSGGNAGKK